MTKPIAWLVPAPIPRETISGSMPATNAKVVIRIGRSRSRLAWTTASCVDSPVSFSWLAWSICRIEFFFTTPNSTSRPSAEKMFSDCRKTMIDSSAKGSVSGSDSRIVIGCSHDLELRRQNQIHEHQRQQERESRSSAPRARARATGRRSTPR